MSMPRLPLSSVSRPTRTPTLRIRVQGYTSHNNYRASSYWMRDCSYLRLKNFEIGYNLPDAALQAMHLETFRIFLQGSNLMTFSNFKLWDPEMGSSNGEAYPLPKTITLGLQVNF